MSEASSDFLSPDLLESALLSLDLSSAPVFPDLSSPPVFDLSSPAAFPALLAESNAFLSSLAFLSSEAPFLSSLAPLDAAPSLPASFLSLLADESPPVDESAGGLTLTTSPPPSPPSDYGSSVFFASGAVVLAVSLLASVLASPAVLESFPELEALSVAVLSFETFLVSVSVLAVLVVFLDPSDGPP